jgi:hypothetical protein
MAQPLQARATSAAGSGHRGARRAPDRDVPQDLDLHARDLTALILLRRARAIRSAGAFSRRSRWCRSRPPRRRWCAGRCRCRSS